MWPHHQLFPKDACSAYFKEHPNSACFLTPLSQHAGCLSKPVEIPSLNPFHSKIQAGTGCWEPQSYLLWNCCSQWSLPGVNTLRKGKDRYLVMWELWLTWELGSQVLRKACFVLTPKGFMSIAKDHNKRPDHSSKFSTTKQALTPKGEMRAVD